jgi:hypothetical protein
MDEHDVTTTAIGGPRRSEGAGGGGTADAGRRAGSDPLFQVRSSDVEPYTGLGYLSKLFRIIAVLLVVLMVVEAGTGLYTTGREAIPTLLSEASRLIVLAGLLWGVGDLATLLIDVGHDVRATRILIGRQQSQQVADQQLPGRGRSVAEDRTNGATADQPPFRDDAGAAR